MKLLRPSLAAESIAAQRAVSRALFDAALGNLLEVDITMAQLKALAVIGRQQNCTIGMLSEQLGIKPPAASLLVDKLVRASLASRRSDPLDGRRVIVHPTAHGTALVNRIRHGAQARLERWVRQLGDDDLAALHRGSRALASVANQSVRSARESTPRLMGLRRAAMARP
jgi:DNA-binding MarR family transcriptional regulator